VLVVDKSEVSLSVRAIKVAVVPLKLYKPIRAKEVPEAAVLAETIDSELIVAPQTGVKNVRYAVPLETVALEFPVRGYTSTMEVV
jgi:hypothetical protein